MRISHLYSSIRFIFRPGDGLKSFAEWRSAQCPSDTQLSSLYRFFERAQSPHSVSRRDTRRVAPLAMEFTPLMLFWFVDGSCAGCFQSLATRVRRTLGGTPLSEEIYFIATAERPRDTYFNAWLTHKRHIMDYPVALLVLPTVSPGRGYV